MAYQNTFRRYEIKYLLTPEQKQKIMARMAAYMQPDQYGRTVIRNLYYDTDNYRLIRHSIEKPVYKEKLRLRSYRQITPDAPVFVELKKKFQGVVYKRRIALPQQQALSWLSGKLTAPPCQIAEEIQHFCRYYGRVQPKVFLSYEREAWYCLDGSDFRVTFDDNILCRQQDLSLCSGVWGEPVLPKGKVLMEVKTSGGIPLWMVGILSEEHIYKTSFSKYGAAYEKLIFPHLKGAIFHDSRTV